uniref:Cyclin N-terminal domain-containing protein n=1 Tax=Marmota marmota marmota TaxID=9994 RepID=A0A8C5Z2Z3_MARMA
FIKNFEYTTHSHELLFLQWILNKHHLLKECKKVFSEEYWKLQIFFTHVMQAIGKHLKLRKQVIPTAMLCFKRFCARYSLRSVDPVLKASTCMFLALKVIWSSLTHKIDFLSSTSDTSKQKSRYCVFMVCV